jgi:hypothetical protein
MKTKSIILIVLTMVFCSFQNTFAQNAFEKQDTTLTLDSTKIIYTCPMHSEIISDKPGTCPKCGMELVKLENGKEQSEPMQHQMGMMMSPMHGMTDMNQNNNEQKKDNMKMMKGMGMGIGIGMGLLMIIMMLVIIL